MIKRKGAAAKSAAALALLTVLLCGCGKKDQAAQQAAPAPGPEATGVIESAAPVSTPEAAVPAVTPVPEVRPAGTVRQNGERYEDVIIMEGMEETVRYEHIRNDTLGFEMDYDYEKFARRSEPDRECFISIWDDQENPENYLELRSNTGDAEQVADGIIAFLSNEYEVYRDYRELDRAGRCIFISASVIKGTNRMPEHLHALYVIPAPDGCRIAWEHSFITESEGMFRRFDYMLNTLTAVSGAGEKRLTDEQAVSAIRNYCLAVNPELKDIVDKGDYPLYWDISSSDEKEIVVVFRSHTGALNRYYVDPVSGASYVTEQVPGIIDEEQRTGEILNAWNYIA